LAWLTGWKYRKSHVINYAAGAGTLYQKQITVHYGEGDDDDDDVYLNSHCRTDFGDVRFTGDDGKTELDYWIQSKVDEDYTIIWVKVSDDLSENNATIYVYYGNAEATYPFGDDQDEMDNTFLFADHFYGSSLNSSKWNEYTVNASVSVADSEVRLTCNNSTSARAHVNSKVTYPVPVAVESRARWISRSSSKGIEWISMCTNQNDNTVTRMTKAWRGDFSIAYFRYSSGNDSSFKLANWIKKADADYHRATIKRTGTRDILHLDDLTAEGAYPTAIDRYIDICSYYTLCDMAVDWIAVRKFVDPEPSHGSWGSETQKLIAPGSIASLMEALDLV